MTDENETNLTAEVDVEGLSDELTKIREKVEGRAEDGREWHNLLWKDSFVTKNQVESFMEGDLEDCQFLSRMALAANAIRELAERCEELDIDNDRLSDEDVQNLNVDDDMITLLAGMMIVSDPIMEYGETLGFEIDDDTGIRL